MIPLAAEARRARRYSAGMARRKPDPPQVPVPPVLHELEAEVMDAVWDADAITVRDIAEELNGIAERPRAYTTYLTICQRLDAKGLLERERAGKAHVYKATISRADYADARAGAGVEALVEQFGDGALVHFAREFEKLEPAERQRLRRLARRG
jgi:predicted transcriptional regulator